jgi:hypothetical protein
VIPINVLEVYRSFHKYAPIKLRANADTRQTNSLPALKMLRNIAPRDLFEEEMRPVADEATSRNVANAELL